MQLAAKFPLGQIVATPGALEAMEASGQEIGFFLARRASGDYGEVSEADRQLNGDALIHGDRVLSAYKTLCATKIWVLTEADRSVTTILLPEDY